MRELLLAAAVGIPAAYLLLDDTKSKAKSKGSKVPKVPSKAQSSPFTREDCMEVVPTAKMSKWLEDVIFPAFTARLPRLPELMTMSEVNAMVDDLLRRTLPHCFNAGTEAYDLAWKAVWCVVARELASRRLIEDTAEDIDDVCADPNLDPRRDLGGDEPIVEPPSPDGPSPQPPIPRPPGPDASGGPGTLPEEPEEFPPPPNVVVLDTSDALRQHTALRFMALNESLPVPTRSAVFLAFNPNWALLEETRWKLRELARAHPDVTFFEASLEDIAAEFGFPGTPEAYAYFLNASDRQGNTKVHPKIVVGVDGGAVSDLRWTEILSFATRRVEAATKVAKLERGGVAERVRLRGLRVPKKTAKTRVRKRARARR